MNLYEFIFAYANTQPYLELIANILPIKIELYGGLDVTVGIDVKILGWTIKEWKHDPWLVRVLLWSWPPDNSPPNAPTDPSPPDGAIVQPHAATLAWTGSDPDGDTLTYDVYFAADDSNPDLMASDQAGTSFDVAGLASNTTYYWRIVAEDDDAATTSGPVWSFRTSADETPPCDGQHATVTFALDSTPDNGQDMRIWGPYGNFLLDDPAQDDGDGIMDTWTYTRVLPGRHTFAVAVPFRWWFNGATCVPAGNCQVNMAMGSVAVTVQACDVVTVTASALQRGALTVNSFEDLNGSGQQEEGEQGLSPWWSELTTAADDGGRRVVASNFDDGSGTWRVLNLVPGREYTACQKPQAGYINAAPGSDANDERGWPCYTFTLTPGTVAEAWFAYTTGDGSELAQWAGAARGVSFHSVLETTYLFIPAVTGD